MSVFREKQAESKPEEVPQAKESVSISHSKVEVPYLDYQNEHGKPFLVDHFDMGKFWDDPQGGFSKEIGEIESYLRDQVTNGEVENSLKAIKDRIKQIEKVTNMDKEFRKTIKLEVIAKYVKFLTETSDIKRMVKRYGNN